MFLLKLRLIICSTSDNRHYKAIRPNPFSWRGCAYEHNPQGKSVHDLCYIGSHIQMQAPRAVKDASGSLCISFCILCDLSPVSLGQGRSESFLFVGSRPKAVWTASSVYSLDNGGGQWRREYPRGERSHLL